MKYTKRILAIIGIVILLGLYITTLVLAIVNNDLTKRFFTASIICTVVIPVLLYVYQWLYKLVKKGAEDARERDFTVPEAENACGEAAGAAGESACGEAADTAGESACGEAAGAAGKSACGEAAGAAGKSACGEAAGAAGESACGEAAGTATGAATEAPAENSDGSR